MRSRWWIFTTLVIAVAACDLPRDADGTLPRVRGGVMRVGYSVDTPWVTDSAGEAGGVEGHLARALAADLGARIQWEHGHESALLERLHARELDLVIGGLDATSPWAKQVALTRPYHADTTIIRGKPKPVEHVLAAAPGENAFLVRLERSLRATRDRVPRLVRETRR